MIPPMDPFEEERPELSGSLISIEFGPAGRIQQLWASDPGLPEEGEDFQFVLPPLQFGEETADDYLPGTILLGSRTNPNEVWELSRNRAAMVQHADEEEFNPTRVEFEYHFPLLDNLATTGSYYEIPGAVPQICWEFKLANRGGITVEVGELGFPLALNNFYEGFGWTDEQLTKLWQSRVYLHKSITGASSWLFAQRMTAETPGLLIFPGENTSWEFFTHVRGSLNTPFQWEGIPIVYAHSKATVEREEWPNWANEHTSLILEPGDSRTYQMRFVPCESDKQDGVSQTLVACGKPAVKVYPSAVAPIDVGIGVEIAGLAPKKFFLSREAEMESDTDEETGFAFVRPSQPGPLTVSFRDKGDRMCHVHLMFTEPIRELIARRAEWVVKHQVVNAPGSPLHRAIVLTNIETGAQSVQADEYQESSGLECALADTLFLAEKNALYPKADEIEALQETVREFIRDDVQNPSNFAVASVLVEGSGAGAYFGRPLSYPHVFNLYHSLYRIASTYGGLEHTPAQYLTWAYSTALAMFRHGWRLYVRTVGVLGFARLYELVRDLRLNGMGAEADVLVERIEFKAKELVKMRYPFAGETVMDTSGFEEVFAAARYLDDDDHLERTVRCAFATRSMAPSWWWYGSDKRSWDGGDSSPINALTDRGEACLSHTTIPNSLIFFGMMDRDYLAIPEAYMRMAFGGMLGPWALVRPDGGASMCYCPDLASKHAGMNPHTGASGLGYYHYLRGTGSYVLPNRDLGVFAFGCHFVPRDGVLEVTPWDGVGRRIVLRQYGAVFELGFGCFKTVLLDERKRWFEAKVENPSDRDVEASLTIEGMWGSKLDIDNIPVECVDGVATIRLRLPAGQVTSVKGKVIP